ncbi:hypothetical protein Lal_00043668 [Lupinus albus]|nr:hypothetical protein Lal_00043668 [Lupinus albus]
MNWLLFEATSPQGWMLSILRANKSITNFIAHNSKRKGEYTCIHIGGAYSRQIKIYHQVPMAGRGRGASQNVPNDLLAHMVAALQQNPSHFQGGFAPDAANEWIQNLERIFRAMGCSDVQKVTKLKLGGNLLDGRWKRRARDYMDCLQGEIPSEIFSC